jgi:hypothetical protein
MSCSSIESQQQAEKLIEEAQTFSKAYRIFYKNLVDAGFNPDQAIQILEAHILKDKE